MSRIRVPLAGLSSGLCDLDEEAARYVGRVHRLKVGDRFVVFDPEQNLEAEAVVVSSRRNRVQCQVGPPTEARRGSDVPGWLLLGLCKGDRFEWALREATALGVTHIVPTLCRSSSSAGATITTNRSERWRKIMVQGARQCGRGDVPVLHDSLGLQEAVRAPPQELPRICLWEHATEPAGPLLQRARHGIVLLIGPEGGLDPLEVQHAQASGFQVASLGPLVLRTETAVVAALATWRICPPALP